MTKLTSKKTYVKIHANVIDQTTRDQIAQISNHPAIKGLISIMPDCHAGAGCVIGFTGRFDDAVIPNVVGVDIGCGVTTYSLKNLFKNYFENEDFEKLNEFIKENIPLGFAKHKRGKDHEPYFSESLNAAFFANEIIRKINSKKLGDPYAQMGTLGGGNHFIEINYVEEEGYYLISVHSGSRNFGLQVANYYQKKAAQITKEMKVDVPQGLEYLPMSVGGDDYIRDMHVAQEYARWNRKEMLRSILSHIVPNYTWDQNRIIESTHNYISETDGIVRKGAIRAVPGEKLVIPLDMSAGIIIGEGRANKDYNLSAPHGAGRVSGRKEMKRKLERGDVSMKDFETQMSDVFSTCVTENHIDESPGAYKQFKDIEAHLAETIDIEMIAKPVYNIKG